MGPLPAAFFRPRKAGGRTGFLPGLESLARGQARPLAELLPSRAGEGARASFERLKRADIVYSDRFACAAVSSDNTSFSVALGRRAALALDSSGW